MGRTLYGALKAFSVEGAKDAPRLIPESLGGVSCFEYFYRFWFNIPVQSSLFTSDLIHARQWLQQSLEHMT